MLPVLRGVKVERFNKYLSLARFVSRYSTFATWKELLVEICVNSNDDRFQVCAPR